MDALIGGWSIDGVARIQTGETLNFGNVRMIGMSVNEFRKAIKLQMGPSGQMFILPDDILQNTVRAFAVSATSPTGYGALGAPTGRYLGPANGPDCIETAPGYGDCGMRSLIVNGPSPRPLRSGRGEAFQDQGKRHVRVPRRAPQCVQRPVLQPGSAERTAIDSGPAARHDDDLHRPRGTDCDRRNTDQQRDRGIQRRQFPPHEPAGRQPGANHPVDLAGAVVDGFAWGVETLVSFVSFVLISD